MLPNPWQVLKGDVALQVLLLCCLLLPGVTNCPLPSAWLSGYESPVVSRINTRIQDLTGLDVSTAEELQVRGRMGFQHLVLGGWLVPPWMCNSFLFRQINWVSWLQGQTLVLLETVKSLAWFVLLRKATSVSGVPGVWETLAVCVTWVNCNLEVLLFICLRPLNEQLLPWLSKAWVPRQQDSHKVLLKPAVLLATLGDKLAKDLVKNWRYFFINDWQKEQGTLFFDTNSGQKVV